QRLDVRVAEQVGEPACGRLRASLSAVEVDGRAEVVETRGVLRRSRRRQDDLVAPLSEFVRRIGGRARDPIAVQDGRGGVLWPGTDGTPLDSQVDVPRLRRRVDVR